MRRIYSTVLTVCMALVMLCACGTATDETRNEDMVEILKVLAADAPNHRLSSEAEQGRLIVFDVSGFEAGEIGEFIEWAREEFDRPPDCFALITSEEPDDISMERARQLVGADAGEHMLSQWTMFTFDLLEYKGGKNPTATVEMGVHFPMGYLVGAGYAVTLEKVDGAWAATGSEMTWIS